MALDAKWAEWNTPDTSYAFPTDEDIVTTDWGSADDSDLVEASFPITAGANSFYKQQAVKFTNFTTEIEANTFRLWMSVGYGASAGTIAGSSDTLLLRDTGAQTIGTSNTTSIAGAGGTGIPVNTEPAANITGAVTGNGMGTNIFHTQILTNVASTVGKSVTLSFKYNVVS